MKASKLIDFSPTILSTLKNYSREKLSADIMAGMIVALPLTTLILGYIKQHHQRNMVVRERKMRKAKEEI